VILGGGPGATAPALPPSPPPNPHNKLIEEHQGEALLVALLRSLILTRQIWECLDLKLTGVILKVTLGVPPNIDAEIVESAV
jgi:hypothetical protein